MGKLLSAEGGGANGMGNMHGLNHTLSPENGKCTIGFYNTGRIWSSGLNTWSAILCIGTG